MRLSCYTAQKLFELQNIHSKHHKVSFNLNPHIYFLHISNFLRYPSASSFFSVASRAQPSRIISNSFGLRFGNLTIVDPDLNKFSHSFLISLSFNPCSNVWDARGRNSLSDFLRRLENRSRQIMMTHILWVTYQMSYDYYHVSNTLSRDLPAL